MLGIAMQVILFSDSILVSSLKSPILVTVYAYALRIPDVSMRFIFKIADVKIPKIPVLYDAGEWFKMWLLHNRLIWLTAAVSGFVCITLILFGGDIIHLWMGQDFMVNQSLIIIFSLNMFTQCVLHVPAIFIQSIGMHKRASILSMIGAPVAVVAAWYLSKTYGLEGIAFSMCAVQFLVGILVVPQFYIYILDKVRSQGHIPSILKVQ
jgi:O-antigen/teichoic acid export membrane protein